MRSVQVGPIRRPGPLAFASPDYSHLIRLSDTRGVFEHTIGADPRPEHGYCVDDVARGLVVTVREPVQTLELAGLTGLYLHFIVAATAPDGRVRNRRSVDGTWADDASTGDCWGRAVWAMGVAAAMAPMADTRDEARGCLLRLARCRSHDVRARAFAALGAGECVLWGEKDPRVLGLLRECVGGIPVEPVAGWRWPEPRLRYANGALAEAVIVGGQALGDASMLARGIAMLDTLFEIETRDGHLSVAGTLGRGPGDTSPLFDQQPIEVAALADASRRAFVATGDRRWLARIRLCWAWFLGDNDSHIPLVDLATGAGYDGLERAGRNDNRGAESTLAALATWQDAVMADDQDAPV